MNKKFTTYDLGLATTLITLNYELIDLDKENPKKINFIFENDGEIEITAEEYWNDKLKISPLKLFNNQKTLKNRLYSNN